MADIRSAVLNALPICSFSESSHDSNMSSMKSSRSAGVTIEEGGAGRKLCHPLLRAMRATPFGCLMKSLRHPMCRKQLAHTRRKVSAVDSSI